jgi:hypothetical protein
MGPSPDAEVNHRGLLASQRRHHPVALLPRQHPRPCINVIKTFVLLITDTLTN